MTNKTLENNIITVALNKLEIDPLNVRKTYSQTSVKELACSIETQGIFQNLLVRKAKKDGNYYVSAGGRRYRAAMLLVEQGKIAADYLVPVKVIDKADALELSLSENVMRENMNPADEFEAFSALVQEGHPIADIAAKFGTTESTVKKRLALGKVAPVFLELYRREEISLEQLAAFTLTDDVEEQVRVWNSLPDYGRHASAIKQALRGEGISSTDKRMRFIGGLESYEAAGGAVKRDLFDNNGGGYALDLPLVERLVSEKLDLETNAICSEGWKWVDVVAEINWQDMEQYGRIYPDYMELTEDEKSEAKALESEFTELEKAEQNEEVIARMAQVVERLNVLDAIPDTPIYPNDEMATAGVLVTLNHNGKVRIERGLVRPEDQEKTVVAVEASNTPMEEESRRVIKHSSALVEDLSAQKTATLRMKLSEKPDVALAAVVHAFLLQLAYTGYGHHGLSALELNVSQTDLASSMKQPDKCAALDTLETQGELIRERVPSDPSKLWDWCLDQTRDDLLGLLAWSAAQSLNVVEGKFTRPKQIAHGHQIGMAVQIDMCDHFKPTAENYFLHLQRGSIQAVVAEACGEAYADGIAEMKKAEGAVFAEKALKDKNWLPEPMRCGTFPVLQPDRETFIEVSEAAE